MNTTELKHSGRMSAAPTHPQFNKQYYVKRLAYRIQEVAYGVDSSRVDKRLSALCERDLDKPDKARKRLEVHRPVTGTQLMREWQDHEHHITVLEDGFEYRGQRYTSLSAIARKITDVRWNDLVCFGLKRMEDYRRVSKVKRKIRAGVYTRKSHEEGLEQEFNRLDAQREADRTKRRARGSTQENIGGKGCPTSCDAGCSPQSRRAC